MGPVRLSQLKRRFVGTPLATAQSRHERLGKATALAVFASDALSSVAYATEEILLVLILAGTVALSYSIPIGIAIAVLIAIVVSSYRQTIRAYPQGGGAYIVSKDNLGVPAGLVAGAALLIDYVLIVAVKPKDMPEVLAEIHGAVRVDQLVISVAAGVPLKAIEGSLRGVPVVRAMPNTSAAVQASVTALASGRSATDDHLRVSTELFRAVGEVLTVPEDIMDVVTALSGSGPAYVYRFIEALIAAGTEMGLTEHLAKQLAVHTLVGAARMLSEPDADSVELRRRVTSPGGTTQAGLTALEERGFASAVKEAVRRAAERAAELAEENS